MKFLIAGLGSIGRRHLRNLLTLGERDIVLYRTGRSTLPDDELAPYPTEHDLTRALTRHKPDAVIVSNPTALHLDVAIPAAEAGCHILLEKPISHSLDRVDELLDAVRRNKVRVVVGFQFRFHPGLLRARQLIQDGEIGRVLSAHVHFGEYLPAWHPWEDYRKGYAARADLGGGVVRTQCHALDYVTWLFGESESVWGVTGKLSDLAVDVEDTAKIILRFKSGVLGSLHLDYTRQPPHHRLDVVGTRGSLQWDALEGWVRVYRASRKTWEVYPPPAGFERNTMFLEEMRHFLNVVRGEDDPACSLGEGIQTMRLIMAVLESAREAKIVHL